MNYYKSIFAILILLSCCVFSAGAASSQEIDKELWKKALRIHNEALVIDAHSHPMKNIFSDPKELELGKNTIKSHMNFITMKEGGLDALLLPLPLLNDIDRKNPVKKILDDAKLIRNHISKYSDLAELALKSDDIIRIHASGKRAVIFSIEYNEVLQGNPETLESYFNSGIRSITISNGKIDRFSNKSGRNEKLSSLSPLGKQVIAEMNRLGILIDISHCDDGLQLDIIKTSKAPVAATHSCVRALNNRTRNIPDNILKELSKNGGAVMIGFTSFQLSGEFYADYNKIKDEYRSAYKELNEKYKENKVELHKQQEIVRNKLFPKSADIEILIDHIEHAVKTAGIDHVGFGSDFISSSNASGLETPAGYPLITYHLLKRGYKEKEIRKIMGGNLLRIFQEVEKSAQN